MTISNDRRPGNNRRGSRESFRHTLTGRDIPCGTASAAIAADETAPRDSTAEPIVVTGKPVHYGVRATSTATKTDTGGEGHPQALSIVTAQQIEDQQLRSVADLLTFVPGASYNSGEGNRDTMVLRGNSEHRRLLRRWRARRRPIFPRLLQCRAGRGAEGPQRDDLRPRRRRRGLQPSAQAADASAPCAQR